ncbi:MAG TPA: hypothetical protein VN033_01175 [Vulgatibacter sp.]|nr:hypothetical protein [Vulgatibacter sp.]
MNVLRLLVPAACLALAAASCSAPEGEPAPGDLPMHGSAIEETGACAERTHETCAEGDGCRTLHAARYDEDRGCRHEAEPVGCMAADAGCGDALTHARDPAGNEWLFFDTCIPKGWKHFLETQADRDAADGPLCE